MTDDLAPLFVQAAKTGKDPGFRQGTLTAYDLANGQEVANSGTYSGGGSGAIGNFVVTADWPGDTDYNTAYPCSVSARVTSGTGKLAVSVQGLYMF